MTSTSIRNWTDTPKSRATCTTVSIKKKKKSFWEVADFHFHHIHLRQSRTLGTTDHVPPWACPTNWNCSWKYFAENGMSIPYLEEKVFPINLLSSYVSSNTTQPPQLKWNTVSQRSIKYILFLILYCHSTRHYIQGHFNHPWLVEWWNNSYVPKVKCPAKTSKKQK